MKFRVYGEGHLAEVLRCELEMLGLCGDDDDSDHNCPLAFIAEDVVDHTAHRLFETLNGYFELSSRRHKYIVIVSQIPPGWTRALAGFRDGVYYQVDTIIVRRAVDRVMHPEQVVVGCYDPSVPLPIEYQAYLAMHDCPVLQMTYEEAELAKCMINFALTKQIEIANVGKKLADKLGGDWATVAQALHNDSRIGPHAYLRPSIDSVNKHLQRDVSTVQKMLDDCK